MMHMHMHVWIVEEKEERLVSTRGRRIFDSYQPHEMGTKEEMMINRIKDE